MESKTCEANIAPTVFDHGRYDHIRTCIAKYSSDFLVHAPGSHTVHGKFVALSGATGNVGVSVLDLLLRRDDVTKVYLLNRRGKESVRSSLVKLFTEKGLDHSILDRSRATLDYLVVDFSKKDLGLKSEVYAELRNNVTHIIHSAWVLNFMIGLEEYEPMHIAGVRHLIDLALASPQAQTPRYVFLSTIAAAILYKGSTVSSPLVGNSMGQMIVPEAPVDDPSMALDQGYGESKYVSERIIVKAVDAGLRATVIRVGQLSGMSTNGEWAKNEYGSFLLRSVLELGVAPTAVPAFRWTPCDIAAQGIVKQAFDDTATLQYFSIENPYPTDHRIICHALSSASPKRIRFMPWREWLEYIEETDPDPRRVPAVVLIDFFRDRWEKHSESAALGWDNSIKLVPELGKGPLTSELIQKYVQYQLRICDSRRLHRL